MMRLMGNRAALLAGLKEMTSVKLKVRTLGLLLMCLVWTDVVNGMIPVNISGHVYARGIYKNKDGNAIWGEYNSVTGEYLRDLVEVRSSENSPYELDKVRVVSRTEIVSNISKYKNLKNTNPESTLLTRQEYQNIIYNFQDLIIENTKKPIIDESTAYVLILPREQRIPGQENQLVLGEFIINPSDTEIGDTIKSVMVSISGDNMGNILQQSKNRIGLKTAFAIDESGDAVEGEGSRFNFFDGQKLIKPMGEVVLESGDSAALTLSNGQYNLVYMFPPCVTFFSYDAVIAASMSYTRFNPKIQSMPKKYTMLQRYYPSCVPDVFIAHPLLGPTVLGPGSIEPKVFKIDFPIDISIISGTATLTDSPQIVGKKILPGIENNILPVDENTQYSNIEIDHTLQVLGDYDFDFDTINDKMAIGYFDEEIANDGAKKFIEDDNPDVAKDKRLVGVWLSSLPDSENPHFTRVVDVASQKQLEHQGLVSSISLEDLENTDIYVIRKSDNLLVAELLGLTEEHLKIDRLYADVESGVDFVENRFYFQLPIRNSEADLLRIGVKSTSFVEWQASSGINPSLHKRDVDHVQAGDELQVVVINRATGYTGTKSFIFNPLMGSIEQQIPEIKLLPPNLRVSVERTSQVTSGAKRGDLVDDQLVGFEGGILSSDAYIKVTTEWLDESGNPMPSVLKEAGFTGQLSILDDDKTLPTSDQSIFQFSIEPGKHLNIVQFPNLETLKNKHFYIHVNGEPLSGRPIFSGENKSRIKKVNFESTGKNEGILSSRPDHYVPFLVPLYDEMTTRLNQATQRLLELNTKVAPVYQWVYRPEMQYSNYEFDVSSIEIPDTVLEAEDDNVSNENVLDLSQINLNDNDILKVLYNLSEMDYEPLDFFNAGEEKTLAFNLNDQEVQAKVGEDNALILENVNDLLYLSPEEVLTLQLYLNNDPGNVLWEWQVTPYKYISLSRSRDIGRFNPSDINSGISEITDSYQVLKLNHNNNGRLKIELLDSNFLLQTTFFNENIQSGQYNFALTYEDVISRVKLRLGPDFYIRVTDNEDIETYYVGELREQTSSAILGQSYLHNVHIARADLSLSQMDVEAKGRGPTLSWVRSYNNQPSRDNSEQYMGTGWSHNHNVYLTITGLAQASNDSTNPEMIGVDLYGNNLPGWIEQTRNGTKPRIYQDGDVTIGPVTPLSVYVTGHGTFIRKESGEFVPQRGYHGSLTMSASDEGTVFKFTDLSGTVTQYQPLAGFTLNQRAYADTITDPNQNSLTYTYYDTSHLPPEINILNVNQKLVKNIKSSVGDRNIEVTYQKIKDRILIKNVVVVGAEIEFTYDDGMLIEVTRDEITRKYKYSNFDEYDAEKNMDSFTDPKGNITRITYFSPQSSEAKKIAEMLHVNNFYDFVQSIKYPNGDAVTFELGSAATTRIIKEFNRQSTYTLNSLGLTTKIAGPGQPRQFIWTVDKGEDDILLLSETDNNGFAYEYEYDNRGNRILQTDPMGYSLEWEYDSKFNTLLMQKDRNGNRITNTIDARGNITSTTMNNTSVGSITKTMTYNGNGNLVSSVDFNGASSSYSTHEKTGLISKQTITDGPTLSYDYNDRGFLKSQTDARNLTWTYSLDNLDQTESKTGPELTVNYVYDLNGNLETETTQETYNGLGQEVTSTQTLKHTYDERNRISTTTRTLKFGNSSLGGNKDFTYDAFHNLESETDWNGNKTSYTYNNKDQLTSITYPEVGTKTITWSPDSTTKTTNFAGRTSVESFDDLLRLTNIQYPDNTSVQMTLDPVGNILTRTNENGQVTTMTYDSRGLVTSIKDNSGTIAYSYDAGGNRTSITDQNNNTTSFAYNKMNLMTFKAEPLGYTTSYAYDSNSNMTSMTDPFGVTYAMEYDAANRMTSRSTPDGDETYGFTYGGVQTYFKDTAGREQGQIVGPDGQVAESLELSGLRSKNTLDNNGNITSTILINDVHTAGTPASVTSNYSYDKLNRRTSESGVRSISYTYTPSSQVESQVGPGHSKWNYLYTKRDRLESKTDALNRTTSFTYDGVGNLLDETNARGTTTHSYNDKNQRIGTKDPMDFSIIMEYDNLGNLLHSTDKRGIVTSITYDELNRPKITTRDNLQISSVNYEKGDQGLVVTTTDALGRATTETQNWRGLVTQIAFADGTSRSMAYDGSGYLTSETDEAGNTTSYEPSHGGYPIKVTDASGATTSMTYNMFGSLASKSLPNGNQWSYSYNTLNQLTSVQDPIGNSSSYTWDANDNLLSQTTPGAATVNFTYDAGNRRRTQTQGAAVTSYSYNSADDLIGMTDPKGQSFSYEYDKLGRQTARHAPAGTASQIAMAYDENSNLTDITETGTGITDSYSFSYDHFDRPTQQNQRGQNIRYTYDKVGNRKSISSAGNATSYEYDSRNRVKSAQFNTANIALSYSKNGLLTGMNYPNNTSVTYEHDQVGRVTTIANRKGNDVTSSYTYSYDKNGNRTQETQLHNGFTLPQQVTNYTFDLLDRLTSTEEIRGSGVNVETRSTVYSYHPSSDRATEKQTLTAAGNQQVLVDRSYAYDNYNRLTNIKDAKTSKDIQYTYDKNGNPTLIVDNTQLLPEQTLLTYNSRDQLIAIARGPPGAEQNLGRFNYDYQGLRIRHYNSSRGNVEYVLDGSQILNELDITSKAILNQYHYADRLLALVNSETQYYHYAALGTVSYLSNEQGDPAVSYRTQAFGEIEQEGSSANRQIYTGQEYDEKSGYMYFGARFYDSSTGRFLNEDTYLGETVTPLSLNRYLYAYGNPTVWVDLTGNASVLASSKEFDDFGFQLYQEGKHFQAGVILVGKAFYDVGTGFFTLGLFDEANDAITTTESYSEAGSKFKDSLVSVAQETAQEYVEEGVVSASAAVAGKLACRRLAQGCELAKKAATDAFDYLNSKDVLDLVKKKEQPKISVEPSLGGSSQALADAEAGMPYEHEIKRSSSFDKNIDLNSKEVPSEFTKPNGGLNKDDFITEHSQKHMFKLDKISTKSSTQFGRDIDVKALVDDTMSDPTAAYSDINSKITKYSKSYDFNISTPDTPSGEMRVFINNSKPHRSTQFPYFKGN